MRRWILILAGALWAGLWGLSPALANPKDLQVEQFGGAEILDPPNVQFLFMIKNKKTGKPQFFDVKPKHIKIMESYKGQSPQPLKILKVTRSVSGKKGSGKGVAKPLNVLLLLDTSCSMGLTSQDTPRFWKLGLRGGRKRALSERSSGSYRSISWSKVENKKSRFDRASEAARRLIQTVLGGGGAVRIGVHGLNTQNMSVFKKQDFRLYPPADKAKLLGQLNAMLPRNLSDTPLNYAIRQAISYMQNNKAFAGAQNTIIVLSDGIDDVTPGKNGARSYMKVSSQELLSQIGQKSGNPVELHLVKLAYWAKDKSQNELRRVGKLLDSFAKASNGGHAFPAGNMDTMIRAFQNLSRTDKIIYKVLAESYKLKRSPGLVLSGKLTYQLKVGGLQVGSVKGGPEPYSSTHSPYMLVSTSSYLDLLKMLGGGILLVMLMWLAGGGWFFGKKEDGPPSNDAGDDARRGGSGRQGFTVEI